MSKVLIGFTLATLVSVGWAFFLGEIKGRLNDLLRRYARRAAAGIPGGYGAEIASEWDAELVSLIDRPVRALEYVKGLHRASRSIASHVEVANPVAGVDIGEFIQEKTGITPATSAIPSTSLKWDIQDFERKVLEDESAALGVSEQELIRFAFLYYLADLDSGRISRWRAL